MIQIETGIRNVGDLSREIGKLHEDKRQWLYRGHADAEWNLQPGIQRGYTPQQEHYLTNEFRVRARSRFRSGIRIDSARAIKAPPSGHS